MIDSGTANLTREADRQFEAFTAIPTTGSGPGVLICTEMWGITAAQRERAKSYAERGFCTIVPNVFWNSSPSGLLGDEGPDRDIAWARMKAFDFDRCIEQLGLAIGWVRRQPSCNGRIAAIGFCMGGRVAVMTALRYRIDAAVSLYGFGLTDFRSAMREAQSRLQLHYGADDPYISADDARMLENELKDCPNINVWIYSNAGHGFFNEARKAYNRDAVTLASQRIDDLFETLR